ncbi:MAG: LuxR C-terminal-related transcriptional regulator [Treponema sp.]|nr:LuxR C-terminal-related transcriptional regulator [Treponema sp.]
MENMLEVQQDPRATFHFERSRLNQLFTEAVRHSLVLVCAGAGYGKTSAVHDFAEKHHVTTIWLQLSERDNVATRYWENYTHAMAQVNEPFADAIGKLGFPDTTDKLNQFQALVRKHVGIKQRIIVMDDFHLIEDPAVIRFVEFSYVNLVQEASLFLISRSTPRINTANLLSRGKICNISENDLKFTENEIAQFFRQQEISLQPNSLREIMKDTEGWAFAINLIARSYQKAPGYGGYLRTAMKTNIFQLMETEVWNGLPERVQRFMVRLSLIDHLSVDLLTLLAGEDGDLIAEMERQNAYVRRDAYINAYLIHHLFLEFLGGKQELLTEEEKRETYAIAGDWCNKNGFKIDALSYYEKIGDYEKIVAIISERPGYVPVDIARYAVQIFDRIPSEAFDRVDYLAVMHVRIIVNLCLWEKTSALLADYEARFLRLPPDDAFRIHNLTGIYYYGSILRRLMCTIDDCYDFDRYYAKLDECLSASNSKPNQLPTYYPAGAWINFAGAARKGSLQEFIDSLSRAVNHASHCFNGAMDGIDDLARGELLFYQGNLRGAEPIIVRSLEQARERGQFAVIHRALFYILRIGVSQGDYPKTEQALRDMELLLNENGYASRFLTYDIALTWYYTTLCLSEKTPDWLKDKFSPYTHPYFVENYGNQAKARYCYLSKNYPPLLAYMGEVRQREEMLYGRVELLAMEACVHYQMNDKKKAFAVLLEAYETASPNEILIPFIELGKDMRTLTAAVRKDPKIKIPQPWLENVNRKASSYAKRQAHVITEYKRANNMADSIVMSPREMEILTDLSHGLSRSEIAASRSLSINNVKMVINNVYDKLGVENLADLIRVAVERKLI